MFNMLVFSGRICRLVGIGWSRLGLELAGVLCLHSAAVIRGVGGRDSGDSEANAAFVEAGRRLGATSVHHIDDLATNGCWGALPSCCQRYREVTQWRCDRISWPRELALARRGLNTR